MNESAINYNEPIRKALNEEGLLEGQPFPNVLGVTKSGKLLILRIEPLNTTLNKRRCKK